MIDVRPLIISTALLVVGWLLGLLSPWLSDWVSRPYRRRRLWKVLEVELRDFRYKVSGLLYIAGAATGNLDRETIRQIHRTMRADENPRTAVIDLELTRKMLDLSPGEFEAGRRASMTRERQYQNYKKLTLPFLSSQLDRLDLLKPDVQRLALELLSLIATLNQDIEHARFNYERTFDSSLSDTAYGAVKANLDMTNLSVEGNIRQMLKILNLMIPPGE